MEPEVKCKTQRARMDTHLIVDQSNPKAIEKIEYNLFVVIITFRSGAVAFDAAYLLEFACISDMNGGKLAP